MAYTAIDDPEAYFQTKIYTGNATDETAITLDGDTDMQPDLIWIKDRDAQQHNRLMDSVRGLKQILRSDSDDTDLSSFPYTAGSADGLHSIDSDGFTLTEDDSDLGFNGSGSKTVAWCWKAGTSFSNDASATSIGSIDSAGSVSDTSGFSIVSWTGTGSNGTIKHGLSSTPKMIFCKRLDAGDTWWSYNETVGAGGQVYLNGSAAAGSDGGVLWNTTAPTSSVFSLGTNTGVNGSGGTYVAFAFADVQGFSKIGSYEGVNNADGPFIYLGFRPSFILIKDIDGANSWHIRDNKRSTYNPSINFLVPDSASAEVTAGEKIDILSNGFKIRQTGGKLNDAETYVYMAFAEAPFVNSNGVPNNAR